MRQTLDPPNEHCTIRTLVSATYLHAAKQICTHTLEFDVSNTLDLSTTDATRIDLVFRNCIVFFNEHIERTFGVQVFSQPYYEDTIRDSVLALSLWPVFIQPPNVLPPIFNLFSLALQKKTGRALLARMFRLKAGYVSSQSASSKVKRRQLVSHMKIYI